VAAEQTGALLGSRAQPDLIVHSPEGLPVIIEAEYMPARSVEKEARGRLGEASAKTSQRIEQSIALRFPESLQKAPQERLGKELRGSVFTYCVYSVREELLDPVRWPQEGWLEGDVDALVDLIENVSISERLVARSLQILEEGIGAAAKILRRQTHDKPQVNLWIAELLCQEDGEQTSRMAMSIVANALTFQKVLEGAHDVRPVGELRGDTGHILKDSVLREWERILREINYWPIFEIARRILVKIPDAPAAEVLERLHGVSAQLAASGVTRSHDLSGRMFQRLISDRKFLATFYTRPAAAALLAHIAVKMLRVDWADAESVTGLRIADLACGTGTLLVAAYHAVIARHRRAGGDDLAIHATMMERALIAADVMPAATHLTASMLSSVHPNEIFHKTQVYTLPFGAPADDRSGRESGRKISLGSLDLLTEESTPSLFGTGAQSMEGRGPGAEEGGLSLRPNSLDLVIMNPPFTAPTNHKIARIPVPSFGGFGTSGEDQKEMADRLKRMRSSLDAPAGDGQAGLASNFLDLAHLKLRPGGVLALVVPQSVIRGKGWQAARNLLAKHYEEIVVITLAGERAEDKAFSADTGMGEAMIAARKRTGSADAKDVEFVTIRRLPSSAAEAVEIARGIMKRGEEEAGSARQVSVGAKLEGQVICASLHQGGAASVNDASLAEAAMALESGALRLPQMAGDRAIGMTLLGELGKTGRVHRDINGVKKDGSPRGPFDVSPFPPGEVPTYPVLWGHNAKKERRLVLAPDCMGTVRTGMGEAAEKIWARSSRLHFTLDFQLSSQSLAAGWTAERAIGGTAWPNFSLTKPSVAREKALLLWANTTLGLLLFWWEGNRQQSGRARITLTGLPSMTALDVRSLTKGQLKKAEAMFGEFSEREFLPANESYRDETRKDLDRAVLTELLGLSADVLGPLDLLRKKWCAEPTVHGGKGTRYAPK